MTTRANFRNRKETRQKEAIERQVVAYQHRIQKGMELNSFEERYGVPLSKLTDDQRKRIGVTSKKPKKKKDEILSI